jgi:hypothetical protein
MQLEEPFYELDRVRLKRWLPWLHLFRAFRLAIHPRCLVLGCLAILLLDAGFAVLDQLPFAQAWSREQGTERSGLTGTGTPRLGVTWEDAYISPLQSLRDAFSQGGLVLRSVAHHLPFARHLFLPGEGLTSVTTALTGLLICLVVWALCGVGISRIVAVRFAADRPVRFRDALGYAFRKLTASLGTVVLPLLAVVTLWFAGVVLGWLGRIPGIGELLLAIGWGLAMLAGLGMSLILLGLSVGWPLMLASVATEDADAFDAFSRIYNYVFARPWYVLFLVVLMLLYGSALIVFTATLLASTDMLTQWAVGAGYGRITWGSAQNGIEAWRTLSRLILHGFVVSYFWSATTIIYLLLRKSEDAIGLDAVTLAPSASTDDQSLPLVGMPAAEAREQQVHTSDAGGSVTAARQETESGMERGTST